MLIFSTVSFVPAKGKRTILIDGGKGVGRVTLKGLDQNVGEAAINSVPRQMITSAVNAVLASYQPSEIPKGTVSVVISIPGGEEVARHTFNPRLGIVGGLSILGTTGIVDPMSSKALVTTFKTELSIFHGKGIRHFTLFLGNYGLSFAKEDLHLTVDPYMMCSNYLGDTIEGAIENGMEHIVLIAHIGKLVKCAIGILNTHSQYGDGRIEAFLRAALVCNAPMECLKEIEASPTTDAILSVLAHYKILEEVLENIKKRIVDLFQKRYSEFIHVEIICFTRVLVNRSQRKPGTCEKLDTNDKVLFYTNGVKPLLHEQNLP
jgi:cobalt-precorrin-5B (C1)-methyltransferase